MAGVTLSVLLLVAGVVAMLVLHILIVFWALRRGVVLRASASRQDVERAATAVEGLSAEDLDGLPCHEHDSKAGAGGECAVCLEVFQAGDRCRALPGCEHEFHAQCVDPWLRKSRVCPVCRAEVVVVGSGKAAAAASSENDTKLVSSSSLPGPIRVSLRARASSLPNRMAGGLTHRVVFITVGLALVIVVHLVVVIWALFRVRATHRVAEYGEEEIGGGGGGLSSEEVEKLPCHEFMEDTAGGGECTVCLEAFRAGARCRVLPRCGDGFHAECIDPWLRKSRRCPVCRAEAVERRKDAAGAVAEADAAVDTITGSER
ncbi:hypothetical protein BAE44_0003214 [Dichanthelium oligosanthes]|uniref:RING-type domain-containing protein n=1 Tax=Dichanthelium oligosanthes TaxID=888268 RepID=A0A1E5WEF3_9POAL|nr:hypothetical protein BAE44_0003214 [Dichanthelium oligosanthes]